MSNIDTLTTFEDTPLVAQPLKPANFGSSQHVYQTFSALVPGSVSKDDLTNYKFWANIAPQVRVGSEIRVLADDCSFRAMLLCTYAQGSRTIMRIVEYASLEKIDYEELDKDRDGFKVVNRGAIGFCVQEVSTGENVKTNLPTAAAAYKFLDEYLKSLAA